VNQTSKLIQLTDYADKDRLNTPAWAFSIKAQPTT
jgi:hypothetical protein